MADAMAAVPSTLWIVWMALVGACIGSFANVLALHWPRRLKFQWNQDVAEYLERSLVSLGLQDAPPPEPLTRRSRCPHCGGVLGWWQLIPLFSFLMLRGRCYHCGQRISWRYPAVEAVAAIAFAVLAFRFPPGEMALVGAILLSLLLLLSLIDIDEMLLPDDLTLPLLWAGLLHAVWLHPDTVSDRVIGAIAGYVSLWMVYQTFRLLTRREGMGFGDFKLLAALGAWLGWAPLLPIVLLASLAGSVWGLLQIALGRSASDQPIPFGPWLALAGGLEILQLNPVSAWLAQLA